MIEMEEFIVLYWSWFSIELDAERFMGSKIELP